MPFLNAVEAMKKRLDELTNRVLGVGERALGFATLETRQANERLLSEFCRGLRFELVIPGSHGTVSNQELFAILDAQKRPFAEITSPLKSHLFVQLSRMFANRPDQILLTEVQLKASKIIVQYVVNRMEGRIRDIKLEALSDSYFRWKSRSKYRNNPIGILTGDLRDSVKLATVKFLS